MAIIHPFKGWLPKPEHVSEIASPPYDVIDTNEAAKLAEGKPNSFLHVIRPEIDLPPDTSLYDDSVYEKGAENLKRLLQSPMMQQDDKSQVYIYRMTANDHIQTGVFTCASVQDYDNNVILKHELTRPDKEDDRTRHILTQKAHAEPVMLTFRDTAGISFLMEKDTITEPPYIELKSDDGVLHQIWRASSPAGFVESFTKVKNLYVADGHHRCKSASRVAETLREQDNSFAGEAEYDYFPVVLFPMEQMKILPYNRVIKSVSDEQFETLKQAFNPEPGASKTPAKKGTISLYYKGEWWQMELPAPKNEDVVSKLDVARLQSQLLEPHFGIKNPRTDENISFVGGSRGTEELERVVNSGKADLAISMYPTSIQELVDVSDQGELMPPKSTWFEPKIKSGIIIHTF